MGCGSSNQSGQGNKTQVQPPVALTTTLQHANVQQKTDTAKGPETNPTQAKQPLTEEEKAKMKETLAEQARRAKDLEDKLKEMMALLEKAQLKDPKNLTSNALLGRVAMECPSTAKIVRIFTSSTFTDTKQERNMLMKYAYPKIKEHCRKIGYEFQVVDMRWGIRDEATDDHMTTELCLKELKLCQKLSTGPNFVSLLSHKYGYTPFPRVIEAEEFEKIYNNIDEQSAKALFQKWYKRDDNCVPPSYILSSVSTNIPDFVCKDEDKKKVAKNIWWEESQIMQEALLETARKVFDEKTARKYIQSVTETETEEGLRPKEANDHFLWLNRNIEDIEKQESNYTLSRYIECTGPEEKVTRARQMLKELKEDRMKKTLDASKILNYSVKWSSTGIDPNTSEQHRQYLESLCGDFVKHMTDMVDKSVAEKKKVSDPLVEECLQHIRFCQSKCEGFTGREDTIEKIKRYVTGSGPGSPEPLVLHGTSGTGKTSILAKAAQLARSWMTRQPVIIIRFLGTSPDSSDLMSLLYSICSQIRRAYNLKPMARTQNIAVQILDFKIMLSKGRANAPLLLFLDSLDQLDHAYNARQMNWLIPKLAPTTKVILSTLPEPIYQCFPALQSIIKGQDNFVDVPVLDTTDVNSILEKWLEMRQRKLTNEQTLVILKAFEKCSTPLFLKLSFEESTRWTSFHPREKTVLKETVRESIEHLFEKLEKMHGKILVTRALSYLSLARNGASEAELEDILSCDDDVLNDVYIYWTPPMRRLPPLLIVRIRNDLSQYLVERGADGTRVLYWYHRQFTEAAEARYCSNTEHNELIHSNLADYFNGTWANGIKKPFTTSNGTSGEEDRHVSAQPFKFDETYNLRALNNLPYHRMKAGQEKLIQDQCLANIHFLMSKIEALPLTATLDDFVSSMEIFPENKLTEMIYDCLLLSQKGLTTDPGQTVPQLLARLEENDISKDFIVQCRAYPKTFLEPRDNILERPGGQLLNCIAAHKTDIDMMDITLDGNLVVTVCQSDKEISLWDIKSGQEKRKVVGKKQCTKALFCCSDKMLACEMDKNVSVEDVLTGQLYCTVRLPANTRSTSICVAGKDKTLLIAFTQTLCLVFDLLKGGKLLQTLIHPEKMEFDSISVAVGSDNYVAVTTNDQQFISVLDLKSMTFMKKFRGFEIILDEEGEEEEHEVEAIAIHPDETHMAYTTMFTSEIIFADFLGNKIRNIPENSDRTYTKLDFTPDGQYLYVQHSNNLFFFNTASLQELDDLEHSKDLIAAKTLDMKTVITVAEDSNLRIWDRTRRKHNNDTDNRQDNFSQRINHLDSAWSLGPTRYIFIHGSVSKNDKDVLFGVYDSITDTFLKLRTMVDFRGKCKVYEIDTTRVLLVMSRKMHVFNLNTMEIDVTLQGFSSKYARDYRYTCRNQLICQTKAGKNIKVYDLSTGKVVCVLKAGQGHDINTLAINSTGTVACTSTDEGPLILYDLIDGKVMYTIPSKPDYDEYFGSYLWINAEGTRLIFSTDSILPEIPKASSVDHLVAWDIQSKKELYRMYDSLYQQKYMAFKSDETTSVEEIFQLDVKRIITLNYDNVIRVYDIDTGKLLNRLEGHTTSIRMDLNEKSPYILSYGYFNEEDCIRIWDKETCQQVATYSLDKSVKLAQWSGCGRFFYTIILDPAKILRWNIHYGDQYVSNIDFDADTQNVFSSITEFESLKIETVEEERCPCEEGDPDTDVEVPTDDEDEDDDKET